MLSPSLRCLFLFQGGIERHWQFGIQGEILHVSMSALEEDIARAFSNIDQRYAMNVYIVGEDDMISTALNIVSEYI